MYSLSPKLFAYYLSGFIPSLEGLLIINTNPIVRRKNLSLLKRSYVFGQSNNISSLPFDLKSVCSSCPCFSFSFCASTVRKYNGDQ